MAPSTDKEWIRALWATPLTHIPDNLLTSIARPRAKSEDDKSVSAARTDSTAATADSNSTGAAPDRVSFDPECVEEAILTFDDDDAEVDAEGSESRWRVSGARLELLRSFDYCGSLLSGRWALQGGHEPADREHEGHGVPTVRVPCKRAVLEEIFSLFEKGELTQKREPSDTLLALVEATADMLGCPHRKINPLLERAAYGARSGSPCSIPAPTTARSESLDPRAMTPPLLLRGACALPDLILAVADLFKLSPLWWALHRDEQKLMLGTSPDASDRALVVVDDELAQVTGYSPMAKQGDAWLFPTLPHALDAETFTNFKVFVDDPAETTLKQMPPAVIEILTRHSTCTAAAGGAVLGGVTCFINHGSDVDIFLYGLDHDGSAAVLRQIDELMQSEVYVGVYDVSRSNAAITYTMKDSKKASKEERAANKDVWLLERPFQIILGLHRARSQIVEYFDLQPCKVHMAQRERERSPIVLPAASSQLAPSAARLAHAFTAVCPQVLARIETKAATPKLIVEALPSFVESVRRNAFHVDTLYWSPASVARISKYIAKGFECAVPGVRRAAFGKPSHEPEKQYWWPDGSTWANRGAPTVTLRELTPKEKDEEDKKMLKSRAITNYSWTTKGLCRLFDMEAEVLRSRAYVPDPNSLEAMCVEKIEGRLCTVEAATIASKLARKLGNGRDPKWVAPSRPEYDDEDWIGEEAGYGCFGNGPCTNTYGFIRETFRCDVAVRLGDARRDIPLSTNFWAFTDAGRFQPAKAHVELMYNVRRRVSILGPLGYALPHLPCSPLVANPEACGSGPVLAAGEALRPRGRGGSHPCRGAAGERRRG